MELKCTKEALDSNDDKAAAFTKGFTYEAIVFKGERDNDNYRITEDNGFEEVFFYINTMFEVVN